MGLIAIEPGPCVTVQDGGRAGRRDCGVGPGGAFDLGSAELANALVGNPVGCAMLELALVGGIYRAAAPLALAIAGAPMAARAVAANGAERPLRTPSSWTLRAGERLVLGPARGGARTYLAVRGGWLVPMRLGSRSSETRLVAGQVLPAMSATVPTRFMTRPGWETPADAPFRVIAGPDALADHVRECERAPEFWARRSFRVDRLCDRAGLRLRPEGAPIEAAPVAPERCSTPVAPGAVQLAGGQLIVLGVACGTMGGYPHIAHVISADIDRLGQLLPGDRVTFQLIALAEARGLDRAHRRARRAFLARILSQTVDGPPEERLRDADAAGSELARFEKSG